MNDIISLTSRLIEIPSVQGDFAAIRKCADFITGWLDKRKIPYKRQSVKDTPSIWITRPNGNVPLLLMAHFDVVSGPRELFTPLVRDNRLYGRGSIDDKYAVALCMVLMHEHWKRMKKAGKKQKDLPFGILLTGDEESGGEMGARSVLQKIRCDFCITLDGGSLNQVVVKEKGIIHATVTAHGKGAHAARPWLGENAITKLMADLNTIQSYFNETDPSYWHRTMTISSIHGGDPDAVNLVPQNAWARIDIRYTENDDVEKLLQEIKQMIDSELVVDVYGNLFSAGNSPYLDLLTHLNPDLILTSEHGASDARFLSEFGIPGVVWGADGDLSQHSETEHVNIESVISLYERLGDFIGKIEGSGV